MHDIKSIRDNANAFDASLKRRGLEPLSASLLAIDETRRAAILKSEQMQARRNAASKEIGDAKKAKDDARASALMAEVAELKTTMPQLELAAKTADEELGSLVVEGEGRTPAIVVEEDRTAMVVVDQALGGVAVAATEVQPLGKDHDVGREAIAADVRALPDRVAPGTLS